MAMSERITRIAKEIEYEKKKAQKAKQKQKPLTKAQFRYLMLRGQGKVD